MNWLRLITIAAAVNYAALVGVGILKVIPKTQGLKPFDLRYFGYSYDDAMAYLSVLRFDTAELLLGPMRWLDTSFPALFTATLIGWGWSSSGWASRHIRVLTVVLPLGYLVLDYLENHLVAKIITGIMPTPEQVSMASSVTVGKFLFVAACVVMLSALAYRNTGQEKQI
ncbi:MAG: hypothetical protein P8L32_03260 [Paracoccaceae bacterium]|jgi:hypothetical protein|nr:hypothetical protein [Paracoccaceae bacterium]